MRFNGGWIKIHRSVIYGDIGSDGITLSLWVTLLAWANIHDSPVKIGGKKIVLKRGQLLTSLSQLGDQLKVHRNCISRHLKYLVDRGSIETQREHRGTIITILNFEKYQDKDSCFEQKENTSETHPVHDLCITRAHNEEEKKKRNNNSTSTVSKTPIPPEVEQFVSVWNENCGRLAKVNRVTGKRLPKIKSRLKETPDLDYWRQVIQRMAASDFCCGAVAGREDKEPWKATFDWLIRDDTNHVKVMEGIYDNKEPARAERRIRLLTMDFDD